MTALPPGLLCATCQLSFGGTPARRTPLGWVHATACTSPRDLTGSGRWVTIRGVARWQPDQAAS